MLRAGINPQILDDAGKTAFELAIDKGKQANLLRKKIRLMQKIIFLKVIWKLLNW